MKQISDEINDNKDKRQSEYEKNSEWRAKIGKAIDDYKVKEEEYKAAMQEHNVKITQVQENLQKELKSGSIGKTLKECEKEKTLFETCANKNKAISDEIQGFVKKFDDVKDEIGERGKKFEAYKMEIESKRL